MRSLDIVLLNDVPSLTIDLGDMLFPEKPVLITSTPEAIAIDQYGAFQTDEITITVDAVPVDISAMTGDEIAQYLRENVLKGSVSNAYVAGIEIVTQSAVGIFVQPHGTVKVDGKFYISTRSKNANGNLFCFPDPVNDVNSYTSVQLSDGVGDASSTDYLIYDEVNERLYASGGLNYDPTHFVIFSINPLDVTDYELVYNSAADSLLGGACPIVTDGIYIYGCTWSPNAFFKIRISDWTLVLTNDWTGNRPAHSAQIYTYTNRKELYFTSTAGTETWFAKVNPVDLIYEEINLSAFVHTSTDDFYFRPINDNGGLCYIGGEGTEQNDLGGAIVNTETMTARSLPSIPTFGIFSDGTNLIVMGKEGYVQVFENFITPKLYAATSLIPNEFFISDTGEMFFTTYDGANSRLVQFSLPELVLVEKSYVDILFSQKIPALSFSGNIDLTSVSTLVFDRGLLVDAY